MPHLKLVSLLTGVFALIVVALVNFALSGRFGPGEVATGVAIGLISGLGTFIVYRNRPAKNCRK